MHLPLAAGQVGPARDGFCLIRLKCWHSGSTPSDSKTFPEAQQRGGTCPEPRSQLAAEAERRRKEEGVLGSVFSTFTVGGSRPGAGVQARTDVPGQRSGMRAGPLAEPLGLVSAGSCE